MSRSWKLALSAFVFAGINFVGIAVGFLAYYVSGNPNQLLIQIPLAAVVSVGGVIVWLLYFGRWHRLELEVDTICVFLLSFPAAAVLFTGLHYLFSGYLTAFGNIMALWVFAFLTNIPALALAAAIWRRRLADGN